MKAVNFKTGCIFSFSKYYRARIPSIGSGNVCCRFNNTSALSNNDIDGSYQSSALYVTGDSGNTSCAVVKPHLDFNYTLLNDDGRRKLQHSLKYRKYHACDDVSLGVLSEGWKSYLDLCREKEKLVAEQRKLSKLSQSSKEDNSAEHESMIFTLSETRKKIKDVNRGIWELEEKVILRLLKLPNFLHDDVALQEEPEILKSYGVKPEFSFEPRSHSSIGESSGSVYFKDVGPTAHYFCGTAARLEHSVKKYFGGIMRDCGFSQVSSPHMCKSAIVEGVRVTDITDAYRCLLLESHKASVDVNKLQLVGGCSVETIVTLLTKWIIDRKCLPVKYFSHGQCYEPITENVIDNNLFAAIQSMRVQFLVAGDEDQIRRQYSEVMAVLIEGYKAIGLPFVVCNQPAYKLLPSECLRTSICVWSPAEERYVECGSLSRYEDFTSKRLLVKYRKGTGGNGYLHLMSGCCVNFPVLLASVMENNQTPRQSFIVPEVFKPYMTF